MASSSNHTAVRARSGQRAHRTTREGTPFDFDFNIKNHVVSVVLVVGTDVDD